MERNKSGLSAPTTHGGPPLHTVEPLARTTFNRLFAMVYTCGLIVHFSHHAQNLFHSRSILSFSIHFSLLLSDIVLAFMWATAQAFRMCPIQRRQFPENLEKVVRRSEFPALDVFICTADPYKEPPLTVVNTALSVLAYDYPTDKLSVFVSDDGGSALTLFALMEAAKFGRYWLPFCRKNNVMERSPEEYFMSSDHDHWSSETREIKTMYEIMKTRVEFVVKSGKVGDWYIGSDEERQIFEKWTDGFTDQDHPAVVQILLDNGKDLDITGHSMPNLIYVSREKSTTSHHHFKGGALNALLRVSALLSNAPIVLTLDCDMYSNNPRTPHQMLCYFFDTAIISSPLGYVQFPQRFKGINKSDSYSCEYKRMYHINPMGLDGLRGPDYFGTGTFFLRRAFFGNPSTPISPEIPELRPAHIVNKPIKSQEILALTNFVIGCNYENNNNWGSKIGFRYGSLVEDYNTGFMLHCEGWKSIFCNPDRAAFYGSAPISLVDTLNQGKRWDIGLLEIAFSKYSTITYGVRAINPLMGLAYSHYAFSPTWSIPIITYAFLPQIALLNQVSIFPKVSESWFLLYVFLGLGAYGQDLLDFLLAGGTVDRWWNDQRMWMIRGLSSQLFGFIEFLAKHIGISTLSFNVTSKVVDGEQRRRYDQEIFEFGVASPIFVPLVMMSMINFVSFVRGVVGILKWSNMEGLVMQLFISALVMVNCWPIYGAMVLRIDKGKMPAKVIVIAAILAFALYESASLILNK